MPPCRLFTSRVDQFYWRRGKAVARRGPSCTACQIGRFFPEPIHAIGNTAYVGSDFVELAPRWKRYPCARNSRSDIGRCPVIVSTLGLTAVNSPVPIAT